MKLSLGAGGLKKNAMYVRNIDMLLLPSFMCDPSLLNQSSMVKVDSTRIPPLNL